MVIEEEEAVVLGLLAEGKKLFRYLIIKFVPIIFFRRIDKRIEIEFMESWGPAAAKLQNLLKLCNFRTSSCDKLCKDYYI